MEQVWEIIGIVVAIIMVMIGLRLLLKKPQPEQPIEQHELPVEAQSQQPIVPRHLRQFQGAEQNTPIVTEDVVAEQVLIEKEMTEKVVPQPEVQPETPVIASDSIETVKQDALNAENADNDSQTPTALSNTTISQDVESTSTLPKDELDSLLEQLEDEDQLAAQRSEDKTLATNSAQTPSSESELEDAEVNAEQYASLQDESASPAETTDKKPQSEHRSADTVLETVEIQEWQGESDVLDAHLSAQNRDDEESALATAEQLVALYMYPNPVRVLSGERTLKMMLKYGLRFGEMSCFHRYEHPEHPSPLMFSVLRINEDGAPTGFDLETLPNEEVKGLAFFLALPNPNAVQGFDMMASIAGLIARDTEGLVFDEQSLELTPQLRDHWRHFVIEYRPGQMND